MKDGLELFEYGGQAPEIKLYNLKAEYEGEKFINVPEGVSTVCYECFRYSKASVIILPDGLTEIYKRAFAERAGLKAVYIPASVNRIDDEAFIGCKNVEIFCESEPKSGWLNGKPERREYDVDMTEAFNFHRSSGSWDDCYIEHRVEIITNNYNPLGRPVHTNVTREQFKKIAEGFTE